MYKVKKTYQVIRILLYANSKDKALKDAKILLDAVITAGESPFFRGYFMGKDMPISGWEGYPMIAELKDPENWRTKLFLSKVGNKSITDKGLSEDEKAWLLLREGLELTKERLFNNLNKIRVGLAEYSNEEFWELSEEKERLMREKHGINYLSIRDAMSRIASSQSTDYFLYGGEGLPIVAFSQLIELLERKKLSCYRNEKLFIIPVLVYH